MATATTNYNSIDTEPMVTEEEGGTPAEQPKKRGGCTKKVGFVIGGVAVLAVVLCVAILVPLQTSSDGPSQSAVVESRRKGDPEPVVTSTDSPTTPHPTPPPTTRTTVHTTNKVEPGVVTVNDLKTPKRYIINLDDKPQDRWKAVAADFKDSLAKMRIAVLGQTIPEAAIPLLDNIPANLKDYMPSTLAEELKGIANVTGVPVGELVLINLLYDVAGLSSTGIVAEAKDGTIWHARSIDHPYAELLKDITIQVDFFEKGELIYQASTWPGYVGILTGSKPGQFSVSVNRKRTDGDLFQTLLMSLLEKQSAFVSMDIREVLEDGHSFSHAIRMLKRINTAAPIYISVAGMEKGDGAVISKLHSRAEDIWYLDQASNAMWFLVETNYDHWEDSPEDDHRREAAQQGLRKIGQAGINSISLLQTLLLSEVTVSDNVYATVMSPSQEDVFQTYAWPN